MGRTHLSPEELVDLIEGTLSAARAAHVAGCARCRRRQEEVSAALSLARAVDVPEPSPLFWEHFSARVREAVHREAVAPRRELSEWWRRRLAVGLAAAVVAVLAIGTLLGRLVVGSRQADVAPTFVADTRQSDRAASVDTASPDQPEVDWAIIVAMAEELEPNPEDLGLLVDQTTLEAAAELLSPAERQALAQLIEAELKRAL